MPLSDELVTWAREPHPALRWWAGTTLQLIGATYILTALADWLGWA